MPTNKKFDQLRGDLPFYTKRMDLDIEIKAVEDRIVTTLFSVAGNVDSYEDRMWPGAFATSLAQRGKSILHLWNHDFFGPPIAVIKSIREVTRDELPEDVQRKYPDALGGAEAASEFLTDDFSDRIFQSLTKGGALRASFGYDPLRYDFTEEDGRTIRNIREVRLWEISTVNFPANEATRGSKADSDFLLRQCYSALRQLEPLIKDRGDVQLFDVLMKYTLDCIAEDKSGARHSARDSELIDQIAAAAAALGATNIKLIEASEDADDKSVDSPPAPVKETSRAEEATPLHSLTLMRHQRQALELLDLIGAQ